MYQTIDFLNQAYKQIKSSLQCQMQIDEFDIIFLGFFLTIIFNFFLNHIRLPRREYNQSYWSFVKSKVFLGLINYCPGVSQFLEKKKVEALKSFSNSLEKQTANKTFKIPENGMGYDTENYFLNHLLQFNFYFDLQCKIFKQNQKIKLQKKIIFNKNNNNNFILTMKTQSCQGEQKKVISKLKICLQVVGDRFKRSFSNLLSHLEYFSIRIDLLYSLVIVEGFGLQGISVKQKLIFKLCEETSGTSFM